MDDVLSLVAHAGVRHVPLELAGDDLGDLPNLVEAERVVAVRPVLADYRRIVQLGAVPNALDELRVGLHLRAVGEIRSEQQANQTECSHIYIFWGESATNANYLLGRRQMVAFF